MTKSSPPPSRFSIFRSSNVPPSVRRWFLGALAFTVAFVLIQLFSFQGILRAGPDVYWDSDPHARIYRVGSILQGHDWIVRFQNVDGYPEGHASHWTLPFDAWCVLLAKLTSLPTAGLLASPILGLVCFLGFAVWCFVRLPRPVAWAATLLYLFQPSFHWAMALGRPDHQSLVHALFVLAVILDLGFWLKEFDGRPDKLQPLRIALNGLALGIGMWTTVEIAPLWAVQIAATFVIAFVMRRSGGWRALGKRALGWLVACAVLVVAFAVECQFDRTQIRIGDFSGELARRWFSVVDEFQPLMTARGEWRFYGLHGVFGLSFYVAPFLVWYFARGQTGNAAFRLALGLTTCVYVVLAFAQIHWVANCSVLWPLFAAIAIREIRERWKAKSSVLSPQSSVLFVAAALFAPCALGFLDFAKRDEFGVHLRPVCEWLRANTPSNLDMERFSMRTPQDRGYSVLTHWWQGPYVQYLARRPVTATAYHTNLDAILDSYRFFVSSNWAEAEAILRKRHCRYVLVEDHRMFAADAQRVLADGRVWIEFSKRRAPDGKMRPAFKFTPLFYETMFWRLHVLNGGGLPLTLVYESEERSPVDPKQARFKVFEYDGFRP